MRPETPLALLFDERGVRREAGANAPVLLEDPESVWLVANGHVNVFAVTVVEDRPEGARDHLFTVEPGGLLPGVEPEWGDAVGLLAVGTAGAEVLQLRMAELRSATGELRSEVKACVDRYIQAFSSAVSKRGQPRVDVLLAPGAHKELKPGLSVSSRRRVAWMHVERGELLFAALPSLRVHPEDGPFPVAPSVWLVSSTPTALRVEHDDELVLDGTLWHGLRSFQRVALEWAHQVIEVDRARERERLRERLASDEKVSHAALESLATVIEPQATELVAPTTGALLGACQRIGRELGVEFRPAPSWDRARHTVSNELAAIARTTGVRYRRVALTPGWWNRDNGPLLGLLRTGTIGAKHPADGGTPDAVEPVALLPHGPSVYHAVAPGSSASQRVDDVVGQALEPFGYQFYRSLPARALSARDLWNFVTFGVWQDVRTIILMGVAGAALGLLLPVLTGTVYDRIIPSADRFQLANVFGALAVATLASTSFQLTRSFAVIRFHTKTEAGLQMAVLDRLLRLPLPFFRQYTAGDLGSRARGISTIGHSLGGATITSILSSLVSGAAYALLFVYSVSLALLATAILAINVLFVSTMAYFALGHARKLKAVQGRLSGLVLELLSGIAKLRVAAAEDRGFARWSREFRREQELAYRLGHLTNHVGAFSAVLSIASTLALYWAYVALPAPAAALTTGDFLAFNAAFGMLMAATMELTGTAIDLVGLIPAWERARPILDTLPEASVDKPDPGELTGRIEVSHLSFRYSDDGPLVLNDVSLEVGPGEFIALVGPSGAGKSTLLRILLGFDMPSTSAVYYDRHDLARIDVTAVRRQIGVVLQSSRLTAGDILSNIAGTGSYTLQEVREAAEMAGMKRDLEEMPLGLHTMVAEGGDTLSGGQRQRLLIARALVSRPRILFFDEATSALDNRAQQVVAESIDRLHATRIMIAHRLSTIRKADKIYVLDRGRVVQSGNFEELMSESGLFADLAARQEAQE